MRAEKIHIALEDERTNPDAYSPTHCGRIVKESQQVGVDMADALQSYGLNVGLYLCIKCRESIGRSLIHK